MKKVLLATLISSALIGCGGEGSDSSPASTKPKFDTCSQVKLSDGVILDLEVREMPDGSKEYGYYDNDEFVLHRDCNDEPAAHFKSQYSPQMRSIWLRNGEHYREEDKPNAVFIGSNNSSYYRVEEWRLGSWLSLDDINDANYDTYTYKDRGDQPNMIHGEAYESGEFSRITYEMWQKNFRELHRVNGPAYISYYDYFNGGNNYYPNGAYFQWLDHGKTIKTKNMTSNPVRCNWTVDTDEWSGNVDSSAPYGSTVCTDEAELDNQYLVWDNSLITVPPLSEKTYEFLLSAGINKEEAGEICKSNEYLRVNCSNVYDDTSMQLIMTSKTTSTIALINGVTVANKSSQFDYSINLNYGDNITFAVENEWRIEGQWSELETYFVIPSEYNDNTGRTATELLDSSGNVLGSIPSNVQVSNWDDSSDRTERNHIYIDQDEFSSVFDFEPTDIRIVTGALPVVDGQQVDLGDYVMTGEHSKAFANALNRAKLIHEYRNN